MRVVDYTSWVTPGIRTMRVVDYTSWVTPGIRTMRVNLLFTQGLMDVTEKLRMLLTIFLSTAYVQNVRLFGVGDARWPFLAEVHTAPLKRFVPSSVYR